MTYVANPTDGTRPLDSDDASGGAAELRALKAYLQTLVGGSVPLNGYAYQGFRNKLVNGNFDLWQAGTNLGPAVINAYFADQWKVFTVSSNLTVSRQAFAPGQTDVPFEPTYFQRVVVASVADAGNASIIQQPIESVRTFAGQNAILTFWAKADAIKNIAIEFEQKFGTGGAPSAGVTGIGVTTKTLGTGWQFFAVPVSIPSITGKTLGTADDDVLQLNIFLEAGSSFNSRTNSLGQQSGTFDIAQVQFEPGSAATPFELLPKSVIIDQAQRYYEKSYNIQHVPGTISTQGALASVAYNTTNLTQRTAMFSTRKRRTPNTKVYNPVTGAIDNIRNFTDSTDVAFVNIASETGQQSICFFGGAVLTAGKQYDLHWIADSRF